MARPLANNAIEPPKDALAVQSTVLFGTDVPVLRAIVILLLPCLQQKDAKFYSNCGGVYIPSRCIERRGEPKGSE